MLMINHRNDGGRPMEEAVGRRRRPAGHVHDLRSGDNNNNNNNNNSNNNNNNTITNVTIIPLLCR